MTQAESLKVVLCGKCNVEMQPGKAIAQTFTGGAPDFPSDTHSSTFSAGGPGALVDCLKCPDCGFSISAEFGAAL